MKFVSEFSGRGREDWRGNYWRGIGGLKGQVEGAWRENEKEKQKARDYLVYIRIETEEEEKGEQREIGEGMRKGRGD